MKYQELESVVLARDVPEHRLSKGDVGTVVFTTAPDHLEVEFLLPSGRTVAVVTLREADVGPAGDADARSARDDERPT